MIISAIKSSTYKSQPDLANKQAAKIIPANPDTVSFQGIGAGKGNYRIIQKIIKVIKQADVQKISIHPHINPDGDAIGSALALAHIIEKATGKKPDIFVHKPLERKLKLIDKNNEIKVISEILRPDATAKDISEKFGQYDAAIGVDNAAITMFDKPIYESIYTNARHKLKIDHHIADKKNKDRNYADINFTDTSKESAAQVVMQFLSGFRIKAKELTREITNPLMAAMAADSGQFKFIKDLALFKDAAILAKTADTKKILEDIASLSVEEFDDAMQILSRKKLVNNNQIAYFVIEPDEKKYSDAVITKVFFELGNIDTVKYCFGLKPRTDGIKMSLRSKDKPIVTIMENFGGGGHNLAAGGQCQDKTTIELTEHLISELSKLCND